MLFSNKQTELSILLQLSSKETHNYSYFKYNNTYLTYLMAQTDHSDQLSQDQLQNQKQVIVNELQSEDTPFQQELIQLQQLCTQDQEQYVEQTGQLQRDRKLRKLNNHKEYPNNCLCFVRTYLKQKNQKQGQRLKKEQKSKTYMPGNGTLVGQHLIICCAHMIINRTHQQYDKQPQRIEITIGNQQRTVDTYRFFKQYQSKDQKVSQLNDVAVLYFKEPVQKSKYIGIGIITSINGAEIMIPKVSGKTIEFKVDEKPSIDAKKGTIIKYKIKTQRGDSGSPIIIPGSYTLDVYYLVGMHKAGIFQNINNERIYKESEGILFNKQVIKNIIQFQQELVKDRSKAFINNTLIEIDKRQSLHDSFKKNTMAPALSLAGTSKQKMYEMMSKIESNGHRQMQIPDFLSHPADELKEEFEQLLNVMKEIKKQGRRNKLLRLNNYLQQRYSQQTQLNETQTIIKQIYVILKALQPHRHKFKQCRSSLRKINQVMDELTCNDLFKGSQPYINLSTKLTLIQQMNFNQNLFFFAIKRQMIKAYLYSLSSYESGNKWFGQLIKMKQVQQNQIQALHYQQQVAQKPSLATRKEYQLGVESKMYNNLQRHNITNQFEALTSLVLPYEDCIFTKNSSQKINFLCVKLHQKQEMSIFEQMKKIMVCYQGAESHILIFLQVLNRIMRIHSDNQNEQKIIQTICKLLQQTFKQQQNQQVINSIIKVSSIVNLYHCQSFHLINFNSFITRVDSVSKLHTLIVNIVEQFLELHQRQYSLCCPIEFCMNININTLQVAFFYVGHPRSLVNFINEMLTKQSEEEVEKELLEFYAVQQILDESMSPNKTFRRVDVFMLGKSLKRFIGSIQYPSIIQSEYCQKLLEVINTQMMVEPQNRIKMGCLRKQLKILGKQYQL